MPPAKRTEVKYDLAKLQNMQEPITIRVERLNGSQKEPIEIPGKDGAAPGTGWGRDDVQRFENWIVGEWAGGGAYHFQAVDAAGVTMEWQGTWSPHVYPMKRPPPLAAGAPVFSQIPVVLQPGIPQQQQSQPLGQAPTGGSWPSALGYAAAPAPAPQMAQPTYYTPPPPPAQQQQPAFPFGQTNAPWNNPWGLPTWSPPPPVATPLPAPSGESTVLRRLEEENRALREEGRRREEEQRRREDDRRREDTLNQRFGMIEQTLSKLTELATRPVAAPAPTGPTPEIIELQRRLEDERRERERQAADHIRERDKLERDRRDAELRAEMKESSERNERLLREMSTSKTDPIIEMVKESARQHAETVREMARSSKEIADKLAPMIMPPQFVASLVKDNSSGSEQVIRNMGSMMTTMFELQKNVFSQLAEMGGRGESPIPQLIGHGIDTLKEMGEKYLMGKRDKDVAAEQTEQMKAQAQAYAMAQQHAATQPRPVPAPGPTMNARATQPQAPAALAAQPQPQAAPAAGGLAAAPENVVPIRSGADERRFGPALGEVHRLRGKVQEFLGNLPPDGPGKLDKHGNPLGFAPPQAMNALIIGARRAAEMGLLAQIPAFQLLDQQMFADLIDALLPQAPQPYREECVQLLTQLARGPSVAPPVPPTPPAPVTVTQRAPTNTEPPGGGGKEEEEEEYEEEEYEEDDAS